MVSKPSHKLSHTCCMSRCMLTGMNTHICTGRLLWILEITLLVFSIQGCCQYSVSVFYVCPFSFQNNTTTTPIMLIKETHSHQTFMHTYTWVRFHWDVMVHVLGAMSCWPGLLPVWQTYFYFPKQKHTGHLSLHTHLLVQMLQPPFPVHHTSGRSAEAAAFLTDRRPVCEWMCSVL